MVNVYLRVYRKYTNPANGKRYARSRGVPDIPFIPEIAPPPTVTGIEVLTRYRMRSYAPPVGSGRSALLYNTTNAMQFPISPTTYVGVDPGAPARTRTPASGELDYTVPSNAANSVPATINGVSTGSSGTGTPVQDKEFFGTVRQGTLSRVFYKNCVFWGTVNTGALLGEVEATGLDFRNAVFMDCTFNNRNNNTWQTNIRGGRYDAYRCEYINGSDGVSGNSTIGLVRLFGCYLHDGAYDEWAAGDTTFPSQGSNYLHCDAIQLGQGPGYYAIGCYFGGARAGQYNPHLGNKTAILSGHDFYNSALLAAQAAGGFLITGTFEQNVFEGGTATINLAVSAGYDLSGLIIKDNIFPYKAFAGGGQWYILRGAGVNAVLTNNRHPDGVAVPIQAG